MKNPSLNTVSAFVLVAVFVVSLCNFLNQMCLADKKAFWLDENYGLHSTIQGNTYLGLIGKKAAYTEANAAPLDYICIKIFVDMKHVVRNFGLSDRVYYRLWPNFVMVCCGLLVVVLFLRNIFNSPSTPAIQIFQLGMLVFLPLLYLYRPNTYYYAAETRPYALWFALWFICITICSVANTHKLILSIVLSLMAVTMVGSVFQIIALGIAFFAIQSHQNGYKLALKESSQVFILPLLLVVFYAFPANYGHLANESSALAWHRFFIWWEREAIFVPVILVLMAVLYQNKSKRQMMIGPLAVLIVFLMGPLIWKVTLWRGYFFTERQYIYYDLHRAVIWLCLINALPFYLERIKNPKRQILVMCLIFTLSIPFVFSKKTIADLRFTIHHVAVLLHVSH